GLNPFGDGNTQAVAVVEDTNGDGTVDSADGEPQVYWYALGNNFQLFYRIQFNSSGSPSLSKIKLASVDQPAIGLSGLNDDDSSFSKYAIIPFAVNSIEPTWLLLGLNGLYVSTNSGDVVQEVPAKPESE